MLPPLRIGAVLALLTWVTTLGCQSAKQSPPPGHSIPSAIAPAADAGAPSTTTLTVSAGGRKRLVLVHAPRGLHGPTALVLDLHGSNGSAAGQEAFSAMDATADAHGFVVAYPEGDIRLERGLAWNVPGQPLPRGGAVPADAADDVDFIDRAIAALSSAYAIDPKRIYLTGMSGGARMASSLACDLATPIAAIAPVGGMRLPSPCRSDRAVSVVAFHGTGDPINPYGGGGEPQWSYGVESAAQQWAAHDGCAATPKTSRAAPHVTLIAYDGCSAGAAVALYAIEGMGHEWPGGPPQPPARVAHAGPQSSAVDANEAMWSFFEAHPLP